MPTGQGSPIWCGLARRGATRASVQALREAGAVILGKTVTTEFAATEPHAGRAIRMTSTRTRRRIEQRARPPPSAPAWCRPRSARRWSARRCGRRAIAAASASSRAYGALNRGGSLRPSDAKLRRRAGGNARGRLDGGHRDRRRASAAIPASPLSGPTGLPPAKQPQRLAVLETAGWAKASEGARAAFAAAARRLADLGVAIADRGSDAGVEALEADLLEASPVTFADRRLGMALAARHLCQAQGPERGDAQAACRRHGDERDDYRRRCGGGRRFATRYAKLMARYDGFVLLGATGAAPVGLGWTGDPAVNIPASLLGVPAISLPLLPRRACRSVFNSSAAPGRGCGADGDGAVGVGELIERLRPSRGIRVPP